jgi:glycosyltransferase involved in cell wall biosynthesis
MTSRPGFTVFIPVYNEESILTKNVEHLVRFLDSINTPYEIIMGSNGSTDRTVELSGQLRDKYQNIGFFHLPQRGVGAAFREGVRIAKYGRIITVDMDLSVNLEFVGTAYKLLDQYDIVIGSKITGRQERAWMRKMASNAFIHLAKALLQIKFHDYSIGAKGYRRDLVRRYLPYIDDKTFYVVKIVYHAYHDGKSIKEIPVECHDTRGSRFNLIYEGIYKFSNLFRLWARSLSGRDPRESSRWD